MLWRKMDSLKPQYPSYWIRRLQLFKDEYVPEWNPHFEANLVSNKVRYYGRVHEHVKPRNPHGIIDIPVIHNQPDGKASYGSLVNPLMHTPLYQQWMKVKKTLEIWRGR